MMLLALTGTPSGIRLTACRSARTSGEPMMASRATGTAVQKGERNAVTRTAGKTTRETRSGSRTRAAPKIVAPKRTAAVEAA
jgi:hypothetical protein